MLDPIAAPRHATRSHVAGAAVLLRFPLAPWGHRPHCPRELADAITAMIPVVDLEPMVALIELIGFELVDPPRPIATRRSFAAHKRAAG